MPRWVALTALVAIRGELLGMRGELTEFNARLTRLEGEFRADV